MDPITFTFSENSNFWRESLPYDIGQNIAGWCQQPFCFQKFVDNAQQCFAFTFKQKIWIFTEGESDGINSRLPFKIFSTLSVLRFCLIFATSSFGKPCRIWFNSRTVQAILYQNDASCYLIIPKCNILVLLRFRHIQQYNHQNSFLM